LGVVDVFGGVGLGRLWRLRVHPSWSSWTYLASWVALVLGVVGVLDDVGLGRLGRRRSLEASFLSVFGPVFWVS
jgi:hypothetical protein